MFSQNRMWVAAILGACFAMASVGCDNKIKDERDALSQQNQQYKAQIDQLSAENNANKSKIAQMESQMNQPQPAAPTGPAAPVTDMTATDTTAGKAPAGKGAVKVATEERFEIAGDVLFDSGKATLKPSAKAELNKMAAMLKSKYAGRDIKVEGHTDATPVKKGGGWPSNEALGLARAKAVMNYLISQGISSKHITAVSMGSSHPKSKTNLAANRRVEIVVAK